MISLLRYDIHIKPKSYKLDLVGFGFNMNIMPLTIFTKALSRNRVSYLCNKLDMINIYTPT